MDVQAAVLEVLKALGPQHRDQIYDQLMTAHAEGKFKHGVSQDPATWTAWWIGVCVALQADEGQSP
jgi:hypothetical protein